MVTAPSIVEREPTVEARDHTGIPRAGFFPGFDGLRAIAALLVLVTHAWLTSNYGFDGSLSPYFAQMDIGVPVFFVISPVAPRWARACSGGDELCESSRRTGWR